MTILSPAASIHQDTVGILVRVRFFFPVFRGLLRSLMTAFMMEFFISGFLCFKSSGFSGRRRAGSSVGPAPCAPCSTIGDPGQNPGGTPWWSFCETMWNRSHRLSPSISIFVQNSRGVCVLFIFRPIRM
jgi:hypothetical protein